MASPAAATTDADAGRTGELLVTRPRGLAAYYEPVLDAGVLPDFVVRAGIRHLLARRKQQCNPGGGALDAKSRAKAAYVRSLRERARIAEHTAAANEQHYEVPAAFFHAHLGHRKKYSACLFENGAASLDEAEDAMLDLYIERAGIEDGMDVLDLGCGWGSFCLYAAAKFPKARFTALSNSNSQREYIETAARARGLANLSVLTADINEFQFSPPRVFDRIVSIEMFEHMKNFASLFAKVASWLRPRDGRLFVHVFAHRDFPYDFKTGDDNSWMARFFFTGGTMPSEDLFMWFQEHLRVVDRWTVDGRNYGATSEAWLRNLDRAAASDPSLMKALEECYGGTAQARVWLQRWRIFYMSVAELFNYDQGQEWIVVHYLFRRQDDPTDS
ncbi:hypothetical protein HK405_012136 [Cladochytrium tenue]|nr:hypothetical protein HK405_012136 [Cladochytrium tenue]